MKACYITLHKKLLWLVLIIKLIQNSKFDLNLLTPRSDQVFCFFQFTFYCIINVSSKSNKQSAGH